MSANVANAAALAIFLLICLKVPRLGVLATSVMVLSLPHDFWMFGFSFGDGDKYSAKPFRHRTVLFRLLFRNRPQGEGACGRARYCLSRLSLP